MLERDQPRRPARRRIALVSTVFAAMFMSAPAAGADGRSEAYVATHANGIIAVLNDASLSEAERSQKFGDYLHTFAYMPDIARRVLGVRGRTVAPADFDRYYVTFEAYATAVYKARFDEMRGGSIRVLGSQDLTPRRSQITMLIRKPGSNEDMQVVWDVLLSQDGQTYRVRDVGVSLGGSVVWLAQDQQTQFEAFLDRNHGDINRLIDQIKQKTADITARPKGPKV
jgi:phospholipid transport system substrate-binding protein